MNTPSTRKFLAIKKNAGIALETAIREKKIDPLMIGISQHVAQTPEFFTTSTCSGRITLMELNENETKKENVFYRKWHRRVKNNEVQEAVNAYTGKQNLWLRQDSFVYVLGTNSWENAKKIIRACQAAGVKRYGVHHFENEKILMEVFGTQHLSIPLVIKGKKLSDQTALREYVKIANRKWLLNEKKRQTFEKILKKYTQE